MWRVAACVVLLAAVASAVPMSEDLYYRAPKLFLMEDFDHCLYKNGTYCMGTFELSPEDNVELYQELMVSADRYQLNRSLLHRGVCVTLCELEENGPAAPAERFQRCVDENLRRKYGLRARLQELRYCKSKEQPGTRENDFLDWLFAGVVVLIVVFNVLGTIYDVKKDPLAKPNKYLMAWSIRQNWQRLTSVHSGDYRLHALAPIHGIKVHLLAIIILAHTLFAMAMMYPYDEREVDDVSQSLESNIFVNGTVVVQTFPMLSSFLLGYMILVNFEKAKKKPSLKYWPLIVLSRYMRMAPTLLFVVGATTTWMARLSQGPQWHHVQEMEAACRRKWWAQLLFINNIVEPDGRCLVQSWSFAVEMQLFVVVVALALILAARPQYAFSVLGSLYVASIAVIMAFNIKWKILPLVTLLTPDVLRTSGVGLMSYIWLFQATWTSLPSSVNGLMLAFFKYYLEKKGFKPEKHKWMGKMTHIVVASMALFLFTGVLWRRLEDPFWLAVYASLDRTVWTLAVSFLVFAYINGQGGCVVRYLSWGGFQILGRLVFSAVLVHWHINLLEVAASPQPILLDRFHIMLNWLSGVVLSLLLATPLHLFVELPIQKMVS